MNPGPPTHTHQPIREDTPVATERRLLRIAEVLSRIGMGRSWLFREVAAGAFPKPIKVGRASAWDSLAIASYVNSLVAQQAEPAAR